MTPALGGGHPQIQVEVLLLVNSELRCQRRFQKCEDAGFIAAPIVQAR